MLSARYIIIACLLIMSSILIAQENSGTTTDFDFKFILLLALILILLVLFLIYFKRTVRSTNDNIDDLERWTNKEIYQLTQRLEELESRLKNLDSSIRQITIVPAEKPAIPQVDVEKIHAKISELADHWVPFIDIANRLPDKYDSPMLKRINNAKKIILSLPKNINSDTLKKLEQLGVPGQEFLIKLWLESFDNGFSDELREIFKKMGYSSQTIIIGSPFDSSTMNAVARQHTGKFVSGRIIEVRKLPLFDKNDNCIAKAEVVIEE